MNYEIMRPSTLQECFDLLYALKNKKIIAGGTDLMVLIKEEKISPNYLIDVTNIADLRFIKESGNFIHIGSQALLSEVAKSDLTNKYAPILAEAIENMAHPHIRNMGTVAGNIANASPAADTATPLIVLSSKVKVSNKKEELWVDIDSFFTGPGKTVLNEYDLITEIKIPKLGSLEGTAFIKLGKRKATSLSVINVAVYIKLGADKKTIESARIALGSVAPTPIRVKGAEESLAGNQICERILDEAGEAAKNEIKPITDVRGSDWYRKEMAEVLVKRAVQLAVERAR